MANTPRPAVFQHGQAFLAAVSERWNYQILREVFFGVHRFGELKRGLGISATMLTARLNHLTELGLLEKHAYREDKPWYEYRLTEGARELVVPAIVAVTRWAESLADGEAVPARPLLHTSCGNETEPYLACSHCHRPIEAADLQPLPARTGVGEEQPVQEAEPK
ncbi:helix-turn-helix transcriptional regulator [Streptomyces sp. RS10V-4]|uniref:winged helix-turn-helix transcriptional regulator n=1 Tax=Streptomyces rhizoryzae TaxID=2932493 RepID=UPI00200393EF|nr:helix-turn-helix domain-containing protein [Streptomyces rhizoryzae]MCK7626477.1 helix-turn-helix transcriptional regulator [Streptomyces rhizoryzae]